jgi:serine/threonine-protein kinase HipA
MNTRQTHEASALIVNLQDRRIGTLSRRPGERNLFTFDDHYVRDLSRPTLSLSFKAMLDRNAVETRPVNTRVPPFFSNLLPEGPLRAYLANGAGVKPMREFPLLRAFGLDLPGAVSVVPTATESAWDIPIDSEPAYRFSLAGVQWKFPALRDASGRFSVPTRGVGGSWILKLPSSRYPAMPENEFVMMEFARRIGIAVPRLKLLPVSQIVGLPHGIRKGIADENATALAVKRFDRMPGGRRVHVEDFAQVFAQFPERKYERRSSENIAAVLLTEIGEKAVIEFIRRIVFSMLIGNGDMHLKNWSLIYRNGQVPELSPAYDFVSTVPYLPKDKLALSFGGSKEMGSISSDRIRRFADKTVLAPGPLWRSVKETIDEIAETWRDYGRSDILPHHVFESVNNHLKSVRKSALMASI